MQLHVAAWDSVLFFSLCLLWQGQCWPTTAQSSIELFFFNWLFSLLFPLDMNARGPGEREKTSGRPVLRISYSVLRTGCEVSNPEYVKPNTSLSVIFSETARAQIGPFQIRGFRDPPDG